MALSSLDETQHRSRRKVGQDVAYLGVKGACNGVRENWEGCKEPAKELVGHGMERAGGFRVIQEE